MPQTLRDPVDNGTAMAIILVATPMAIVLITLGMIIFGGLINAGSRAHTSVSYAQHGNELTLRARANRDLGYNFKSGRAPIVGGGYEKLHGDWGRACTCFPRCADCVKHGCAGKGLPVRCEEHGGQEDHVEMQGRPEVLLRLVGQ
jgi:hypothetical protein